MNELEATRAKLKCLEMVEGTGLKWWEVVRFRGRVAHNSKTAPDFSEDESGYEFALGALEGKPVWEGNTIFDEDGMAFGANAKMVFPGMWSWNPMPKTVMVTLPIAMAEYYATLQNQDVSTMREACKKALEEKCQTGK